MRLIDRRLVIVVGKGGVGRSTVAHAVARAAASTGRRVALAEVHGAGAIAGTYGWAPHQRPRAIRPGLDLLGLSAAGCLEEYGVDRLRIAPLARFVLRHHVISAFLDAVPGMDDLLHLGKLNSLLERDPGYDLVVVDAPATGHGLSLYRTAGAMAETTRSGPLHEESARIAARLADPAWTALVLITLPEALPANEALELLDALGTDRRVVGGVVVNRVRVDPLPPSIPWERVRASLEGHRALMAVGDRLARRLGAERAAVDRLRAAVGDLPVAVLPRLHGPVGPAEADLLGHALLSTLEAA